MKEDLIVKVQCLTCKKEHKYRSPKGLVEPKPVKVKKVEIQEEFDNTIETEWAKLMATHSADSIRAYSKNGHFDLGDKISHPTFGDGIVSKLIYPNKLEVVFKLDIKILIYKGVQN